MYYTACSSIFINLIIHTILLTNLWTEKVCQHEIEIFIQYGNKMKFLKSDIQDDIVDLFYENFIRSK